MIYNWRSGSVPDDAKGISYSARDAATNEPVPFVFYYDTDTKQVGRFLTDTNGQVILNFRAGVTEPGEIWETRELVLVPGHAGA